MNLLICNTCEDVIKLTESPKTCHCGACGGALINDKLTTAYGKFTTISIPNKLSNHPHNHFFGKIVNNTVRLKS